MPRQSDSGSEPESPEILHDVLLVLEGSKIRHSTAAARVSRYSIDPEAVHTLHLTAIDKPTLAQLTGSGWEQIPYDFKDGEIFFPNKIGTPLLQHLQALENIRQPKEFIFRHSTRPLFFSASLGSTEAIRPLINTGWMVGDFREEWHHQRRKQLAGRDVLPDTSGPESDTLKARRMIEDEYALQLGRSLAQKMVVRGGIRYFPLSFAAPLTQAPETTIRDWITKDKKFNGKPIKTYVSPSNGLYVSEDSVSRMTQRFIKWQKGKSAGPAGTVNVGETDDHSGYISLPDAARTIGVGHNTLWRWATTPEGRPPGGTPLVVIKCPASDQFYIRESDVLALKNVIPRSGLSRGPRPQTEPRL
jgi:hypothetical protein